MCSLTSEKLREQAGHRRISSVWTFMWPSSSHLLVHILSQTSHFQVGRWLSRCSLNRGCEFAFISSGSGSRNKKKLQLNPDYETRNATFCKKPCNVGDPWHFGVDPDPDLWLRDPDPDPKGKDLDRDLWLTDQNPGSPKTCGSCGSGSPIRRIASVLVIKI